VPPESCHLSGVKTSGGLENLCAERHVTCNAGNVTSPTSTSEHLIFLETGNTTTNNESMRNLPVQLVNSNAEKINGGSPQTPRRRLFMSSVCALYNSWLFEMLRNGGPVSMDAVAWLHVRNHAELCQHCQHDAEYMSAIEVAQRNWERTNGHVSRCQPGTAQPVTSGLAAHT
jgi:hypothetical protein